MAKAILVDSFKPVKTKPAKMQRRMTEETTGSKSKTRAKYSQAETAETTHVAMYEMTERPKGDWGSREKEDGFVGLVEVLWLDRKCI